MYDYFYGAQADQFSFIRIPTVLFSQEQFKNISPEAKVLYGILLKRMDLSAKNGWFDDQGRVYIICTLEEIMETLNCGNQKAVKLMDELEGKIGLIERKRQGLGKPNLIYVKNFISCADGQKSHSLNHENHESGNVKITGQESWKSHGNNTNSNNTNFNNTDLISFGDDSKATVGTKISYKEYFRKRLEIDLLKKNYPWQLLILNGIFNLIVDTCSSNNQWIMISGSKRPLAVVKSRFMRLNKNHIEYVLKCLSNNTEEIQDMRHYLLATLYNVSALTNLMNKPKNAKT